jgi:hypothetical protein
LTKGDAGHRHRMVYLLLAVAIWLFFETLSIINSWGGLLGYVVEPVVLAAMLAGLVGGIAASAQAAGGGDAPRHRS